MISNELSDLGGIPIEDELKDLGGVPVEDELSDLGAIPVSPLDEVSQKILDRESGKVIEVPGWFHSGLVGASIRTKFYPDREDAGELGRSTIRGVMKSGENIGHLINFIGDQTKENQNPASANLVGQLADMMDSYLGKTERGAHPLIEKLGDKTREIGDRLVDKFKDLQESLVIGGVEVTKANPEIWRGTYWENPNFTRTASLVATAIPSLATAAAVTFATKNPFAGAAALGMLEGAGQYSEAREAGMNAGTARYVFMASSIGSAVLEGMSLGRFFKNAGRVSKASGALEGAASEGLTEAAQTLWQNTIAKIGYDEARNLFEGITEAIIAGAGSGGIIGGLTAGGPKNLDKTIETLKEKGATEQDIQAIAQTVADDLVQNAETIDQVLTEKATEIPAETAVPEGQGLTLENAEQADQSTQSYLEDSDIRTAPIDRTKLKNPSIFRDIDALSKAVKTRENALDLLNEYSQQLTEANKAIIKAGSKQKAPQGILIQKTNAEQALQSLSTIINTLPVQNDYTPAPGEVPEPVEAGRMPELLTERPLMTESVYRREVAKSIRDHFGLTDEDLKKVSRRDPRLMDAEEFREYIKGVEARASELAKTRDLKNAVMAQIQEKQLRKYDNLRELMKLPPISQMNSAQLKQFDEALEEFQEGDEFISLRKLETVKNTELAGIKTVREAREVLAKKLGVPLEKVSNIRTGALDKFIFDTPLAEKNPFYKLMVDETNASFLDAEQKFLNMEREVDELTKRARESRKRSLIDKLIPTDDLVFAWMESPDKDSLAKEMTDEELDLATYLQVRFAQFRHYLVEHQVLKHFQTDYITHIRRGFLESWKVDGVLPAFVDVFQQYQQDESVFKILEDDTQNILPLEKFFQFAMHRTGELKPSKNVSRAFKNYTQTMLKKQALDKIVPALDIYAYSLSPSETTPRGLQMDRTLIKFVREWINNKKGRKSSLGGAFRQGGEVDLALRAINGFVTIVDLGLNIPVGIAANVGEQAATYINLGTKKYSLGIKRMNTAKGKKIISENRAFIGKTIWDSLTETSDNIGDKLSKGLYLLFQASTINANKIHLLGSMTESEWQAGKISADRLAQLKREIGRFRAVEGAKSIIGSTSVSSLATKYKTWAVPILTTVAADIKKLSGMIKKGEGSKVFKTQEFQELLRGTTMTAFFVLTVGLIVDEEDESPIGKLINKAYRETLTFLQALNPRTYTSWRILQFLDDTARSITELITLQTYKSSGDLKAPRTAYKTFVPRAVKNLLESGGESGRKSSTRKLSA